MTKQEQKDAALKAYEAIQEPAYAVYKAELKRINNEPEDIIEVDGKRYQLIK